MKIKIILRFILFVNFFTYGQEKNIYILYNKSDLLTSYNEELIASKDSALFWNEVQVKTDGSNQMTDDGNGNFNLIDENYHIFKNEISLIFMELETVLFSNFALISYVPAFKFNFKVAFP